MDSSPEPHPEYAWQSPANAETIVPTSGSATDTGFATPAPVHPPAPNRFFFGRFGMRAGYGILIVLVIWALLGTVGGICGLAAAGQLQEVQRARAYAHEHPHAPRPHLVLNFIPTVVILQDAIVFLPLLGVCWLFARAERRPLGAYGIGRHRLADILPGSFWGLAVMSGLIATLKMLHLLVFDSRNVYGAAAVEYGATWLLAFLLVGFAEEYFFRGYIQYTLMRGVWGLAERISATGTRAVAFWIAAIFWSLLFLVAHIGNGGENLFGLVQVFLAGVTFAYALWRTGSLWWAIGYHMTWDWAQSFLYGVPDSGNLSVGRLFLTHPQGRTLFSGGADGPEGSIYATLALLITIAIIRLTTRPGTQPALEQRPKLNVEPQPSALHNSVA